MSSLSICWSDKLSPSVDASISDQFHSDMDVTFHKFLKIWEEIFSNMLPIKLFYSLLTEFGHLKLINLKSFLLDSINNFSNICVTTRFYHCEGALSRSILFVIGCSIPILSNMEHSGKYCNFRSNEKVRKTKSWYLNSFQENSRHFLVVHFNGIVKWIEENSVESDDISLLIIPFSFKNVSFFFYRFCGFKSCHFQI